MITRSSVAFTIIVSILFYVGCCDVGAEVYFFKLRLPSVIRADDYSRAQEQSSWCWAASAEMALRSQGIYNVSQAAIVASIRGIPVNKPGYVHEVARALTGIAQDRLAGIVVSQAVVYSRRNDGKFVFNNSYMNGPGFAFLMAHGVPVIAFHRTGGSVGHFVLVSGVSIDSNDPLRVVHYQIEDPWPLDDQGNRITGNRGVQKQLDAAFMESNGIAFITPLIIADTNVDHMQQFLANYREIARNPSAFKLKDFVRMVEQTTTAEVTRFKSLGALGEAVHLPLHDNVPNNFRSFATLGHGDNISNARKIFGVPESSSVTRNLVNDSYCDGGFNISYNTETKLIKFIRLSDEKCVDWVKDKAGDVPLLQFYGKRKSEVKAQLGAETTDEADYLTYDDNKTVELQFTCYDFKKYKCNNISLHWY